jgi:hypothetical protein
VFTKARKQNISWASSNHSPHSDPIRLRFILIMFSWLCLGHSNRFPLIFLFRISRPFKRVACSSNITRPDLITLTILSEEQAYKVWSSLCSFSHPLVTPSSLSLHILVNKGAQPRTTEFCTVALNICGSSVWNLLRVTLMAARILKLLLNFWKICAALLTSTLSSIYAFSFLQASCTPKQNEYGKYNLNKRGNGQTI